MTVLKELNYQGKHICVDKTRQELSIVPSHNEVDKNKNQAVT